ncbi:hypothetical protein AZE42_07784 [Rhizopogon vesiculosus]|uniref:Uncharacterized protein n=1 Tax=Rhizopogon vesiculosus TaxID=180088 RepID=A0A1J8R7H6_9AGAM|nr:hypothetical protein AZE42_07784 [Rhizopogon vesiculosus]
MSLTQSRDSNVSATGEKLDGLEELGPKQPPASPTPSLEPDLTDGGLQAWATVFGCYSSPDSQLRNDDH